MEEEEDAEDDEQTLDEQEKTERGVDHDKEIAELEKEGTTSIIINKINTQK